MATSGQGFGKYEEFPTGGPQIRVSSTPSVRSLQERAPGIVLPAPQVVVVSISEVRLVHRLRVGSRISVVVHSLCPLFPRHSPLVNSLMLLQQRSRCSRSQKLFANRFNSRILNRIIHSPREGTQPRGPSSNHPRQSPTILPSCPYFPVFGSPAATLEVVGNTGNMSSEKAGVGGSTPSLATTFSAAYSRPPNPSCPNLSQTTNRLAWSCVAAC